MIINTLEEKIKFIKDAFEKIGSADMEKIKQQLSPIERQIKLYEDKLKVNSNLETQYIKEINDIQYRYELNELGIALDFFVGIIKSAMGENYGTH